jgi:hypothetical protein
MGAISVLIGVLIIVGRGNLFLGNRPVRARYQVETAA